MTYRWHDCQKAGLEIRDGGHKSATLLQKICGGALPNPVFSTTSQLWVYSWNKMSTGWLPSYDFIYTSSDQGRGCGGTLYNYKGSFTSPFYPLDYKNSTPCEWDIRVPIGMKVGIKFSGNYTASIIRKKINWR